MSLSNNFVARDPLTPGTCEVCGKPCELTDATCSLACEAILHKREMKQGRELVRELKLWRKHRGRKGTPGEGGMTRIAARVDAMLKEDRAARETRIAARKEAETQKEEADAVPTPTPE